MWYIAKLVFQIKGKGMHTPQFDEHLRLIEAHAFEEAFLKARVMGIGFEETVLNKKHGTVSWEFVNVAELRPIEEFKNGMELHSQVREMEEANQYIRYIHNQAASMQLEDRPLF
ncbi:MAG: hypothetical protein OJF59_000551 [Cytophagales bacterium]|jgi:hypothetical protein|nr:DUF4288 domain-containing protein [Bacteroidota bacterium]MBS1981387.1 DUF4288 domain-containing protein [Bacteroidota bacterium]WHZ06798.1 MAG: hypothetical protein OJF59_000551 [Cytophagales bacterium]